MFQRLPQLSTGQRVLKNFLSLAGADILGKLIAFGTIAYLARVLSASGFGQISFAQATIAYFTVLSDLGLTQFGVREVARDEEHIKKYVNNILTLKLVLAITSFALLVIFLALMNKPTDHKTLIAFYGLSLFPSVLFLNWVFQGVERMEYVGIANILRSLIYAGLVFLFVNSPSQILSVPLFALTGSFIMILPLIYTFVKRYGWFTPSFNLPIWKHFLAQALPMGLAFMMIQIYYNMDSVMLGFMKGNESVGLYNAAYKILVLLISFRAIFIHSLFPELSRLYSQSRDRLAKVVLYAQKMGISLAIPLGVGGTLLAKSIIALLYGAQYQGSVVPFQLLIWNAAVLYVNLVFPQLLNAADRQKLYAKFTMTGAAVNMLFNYLLIIRCGIIGAAIATVLAETAIFILSYRAVKRFLAVSIAQLFWRPILASLVMAIPLIVLQGLHVLLLITLGAACYTVVLWLLGGISISDIRRVLRYRT
jgi:O-antigen/teichoic acid export membrane protein